VGVGSYLQRRASGWPRWSAAYKMLASQRIVRMI
jgi:hypothetical protein